jgi:hypothetical protein
MKNLEDFEKAIYKIVKEDFRISCNGGFKEKNITLWIEDCTFKTTSDNWGGAYSSIIAQLKGFLNK